MSSDGQGTPAYRLPDEEGLSRARSLLARRLRACRDEVDDVVQDAIAAYLKISPESIRNPNGLFYRIAVRKAVDFVASSRRIRILHSDYRFIERRPPLAPDTPADVYLRERALLARRDLGAPPGKVLEVIRDLESGFSLSEALQRKGLSAGSCERYRAAIIRFGRRLDRGIRGGRKKSDRFPPVRTT